MNIAFGITWYTILHWLRFEFGSTTKSVATDLQKYLICYGLITFDVYPQHQMTSQTIFFFWAKPTQVQNKFRTNKFVPAAYLHVRISVCGRIFQEKKRKMPKKSANDKVVAMLINIWTINLLAKVFYPKIGFICDCRSFFLHDSGIG